MQEEQPTTLKEKVLASIEKGEAKMKPKWHFVLKFTALASGSVLVFLSLLYLASFAVFSARQRGVWFAPGFGARGFLEMFFALPWLIILVALVFMVVLQVMIRRYTFAYGQPLFYSAAAILLLSALGGIFLGNTPMHRGFYTKAQNYHMPFMGDFYREMGLSPKGNLTVGTILEKNQAGFNLETRKEEILQVLVSPKTDIISQDILSEGDVVLVLGTKRDKTLNAEKVREITGQLEDMPHFKDRRAGMPGMFMGR